MKAKKALKRLTKIETWLADMKERHSQGPLHVKGALQDAQAAFARVKAAVMGSASSSEAAKTSKAPPMNKPEPAKPDRKLSAAGRKAIQKAEGRQKKQATATTERATKKVAPARKRATAKTKAPKAPTAKTAKKRAAPKKAATKKTAAPPLPASAQAATEPSANVPVGV